MLRGECCEKCNACTGIGDGQLFAEYLPSCSCICVFCRACVCSKIINLSAVSPPCSTKHTEWIKSWNNTRIPHCSVSRSKVMAWTEDYLLCVFLSHCHFILSFLALSRCFYNFLICLLPVILFFYPLLYSTSLCLVYVEYEGWNISSLCSEVASCSGPPLHCTVHFSQGERVISLLFRFTVQLSAGFWNISGAFR